VKLFGSELPGAGLVRNFGLLLFDLSPTAKRALARVSWGFAGRMPRLARGLTLE
jgi:2-octaprenyl-6-methoxyphenol hydroxylase